MSSFKYSVKTLKFYHELAQVETETFSLQVCLKSCDDSYQECINAGKDKWKCGEALRDCKQKCRQNNPSNKYFEDKNIQEIIDTVMNSVED